MNGTNDDDSSTPTMPPRFPPSLGTDSPRTPAVGSRVLLPQRRRRQGALLNVGFSPEAGLDGESSLWATSFAVTQLGDRAEQAVADLIRKAAG
jgi:hypothetical protein